MRISQFRISSVVMISLASSIVSAEVPDIAGASIAAHQCDTLYVGPPGGSRKIALNWEPYPPRQNDSVCFPDQADRLVAEQGAKALNLASPPPPPTMIGACCLGSSCSITDYFDCREQGGFFTEGITACFSVTCETGACCLPDQSCEETDALGVPMDEAACNVQGGTFLGEATCETDPCAPFRIPEGFEIVEVDFTEGSHGPPRINECGQIVFAAGPMFLGDPEDEVWLYDNGSKVQVTNDPTVANDYPDINDQGTIVWTRAFDGWGGGHIVMKHNGIESYIAEGAVPRINNQGHMVFDLFQFDPPEYPSTILFYDGDSVETLYDDDHSNQSPAINDQDDVTWTRYDFTPDPPIWEWTSEIMLRTGGTDLALPSVYQWPQGPDVDDLVRVAWGIRPIGLEVWEAGTTSLFLEGSAASPSPNVRSDLAYSFKLPALPWEQWLYTGGQHFLISKPNDTMVNGRGEINEMGEIAWWRYSGNLVPSGIQFMRRIRRGDVDFDGDVDIDDVIPMARCYTGSVITDGLCHCRFYDIDHDRDIDHDDFDLLMRNYVGALDDCNNNSILDFEELLDGRAADCNYNGIVDTCDITADPLLDSDSDGFIDACCQQAIPTQPINVYTTNRYLTFEVPDSPPAPLTMQGDQQNFPTAIRVTFIPSASLKQPNHRLQTGATLLGESLQTGATPSTSVSSDSSPLAKGGSRGVVQLTEDLPQPLLSKEGRSSATLVAESLHTETPPELFETPDAHAHTDAPRGLSATLIAHSHTETPRGLKSAARAEGAWVMWVGPPSEVSENGGSVDPVEGFGTFMAATLQCSPYYHDFGSIDVLHVYHQAIIPESQYEIQTIRQGCGSATEVNFSPPLAVDTSRWADSVGPFDGQTWPPPDGVVGIPSDVLATIDKFQSLPTSPSKTRVDIAPDTPNRVIDITDITRGIGAFRGEVYPFSASPPCP